MRKFRKSPCDCSVCNSWVRICKILFYFIFGLGMSFVPISFVPIEIYTHLFVPVCTSSSLLPFAFTIIVHCTYKEIRFSPLWSLGNRSVIWSLSSRQSNSIRWLKNNGKHKTFELIVFWCTSGLWTICSCICYHNNMNQ